MLNVMLRFILVLFFSLSLFSQDISEECGTSYDQNFYDLKTQKLDDFNYFFNEYYEKRQQKSSTAITDIPVRVNILQTTGGNTAVSENDVINRINDANEEFADSYMSFYICDGINYITDNALYNYNYSEQEQLLQYNQENIMNIYFMNSITTNSGGGICGFTYFPQGFSSNLDILVMSANCSGNLYNTFTHELGHHFGVEHTHGPVNGILTSELVSGANCNSAGDYICDTAADPQLSSANVSSVNCIYSPNTSPPPSDAQGQFFDPDTSNFMSYAPQSCRYNFTTQQNAIFYATFHSLRSYYSCPSFNITISDNIIIDCDNEFIVDFYDESPGAISWEWDVDGDDIIDYTEQNPTHVYSEPGLYDVVLNVSNGTETLTKAFAGRYDFKNNASENFINFSINVVNPGENTWEIIHESGYVVDSGGPYDEQLVYEEQIDLYDNTCYDFVMYDNAGNGMEDFYWEVGYEMYEVFDNNNVILIDGIGPFGNLKSDLIYIDGQDYDNDLGILLISAPTSGTLIEEIQNVEFIVVNSGQTDVNNFEVSFQLDNGDIVYEQFNQYVPANGGWINLQSETSFDFSTIGTYSLITSITNFDDNTQNNSITVEIVNSSLCQPFGDCNQGNGNGVKLFTFGDIYNESGCEGYANFMDQSTDLIIGDYYGMTIASGYGSQYYRVWIDYNDDYQFTSDELIVNNPVLANNQGAGNYSGTLQVQIPEDAMPGQHILRIKSNTGSPVPSDACEQTTFSETEDYMVNIINPLSLIDDQISDLFELKYDNLNKFLTISANNENLKSIKIYDMTGKLVFGKIINSKNKLINLSKVSNGIYTLIIETDNHLKHLKFIRY
jgi:PKD repeat protein